MNRNPSPLFTNESEEISVNGQIGIWLNKVESQGHDDYPINKDTKPLVITKKSQNPVDYVQELAVRYLRPPTPPVPGEIIISQKPNIHPAPAPPLIVRQAPRRPGTPEPLLVRERPPVPPSPFGMKVITISGFEIFEYFKGY